MDTRCFLLRYFFWIFLLFFSLVFFLLFLDVLLVLFPLYFRRYYIRTLKALFCFCYWSVRKLWNMKNIFLPFYFFTSLYLVFTFYIFNHYFIIWLLKLLLKYLKSYISIVKSVAWKLLLYFIILFINFYILPFYLADFANYYIIGLGTWRSRHSFAKLPLLVQVRSIL